jgi:hypothetical protein
MVARFDHRQRDFVFLVQDTSSCKSRGESIASRSKQIAKILSNILEESYFNCVEEKDRIALLKFSKCAKRVFSLVEKRKNYPQLKR